MRAILIIALGVLLYYFNVWPFDKTEQAIQDSDFNAYFYYPNDTEHFLGKVQGLEVCGSVAYSFAYQKGLAENNEWSYICCRVTSSSECASKHR